MFLSHEYLYVNKLFKCLSAFFVCLFYHFSISRQLFFRNNNNKKALISLLQDLATTEDKVGNYLVNIVEF